MDWPAYIKQWNQLPVKVWDVRHIVMQPGALLDDYRLPSNIFLLARRGNARIRLDGRECAGSGFQLLHGKKGARLDIWAQEQPFDYYMILYKPLLPARHPWHASGSMQPNTESYSMQPYEPFALLSLLERMHRHWAKGGELERLQTTGLFYQFVYEQFRQIERIEAGAEPPELAEQVARYIHDRIREPISLETMAGHFHYSTRYLTRVFKRKFGCSPTDYMIQKRIALTKRLLETTDASIREVAAGVGYTDMYYFSKLFKKQTGVTPRQYKLQPSSGGGSISPINKSESFIAVGHQDKYSIDNENCSQNHTWRVHRMNGNVKPAWTLSLLLALTMLLAACGATGSASPSHAPASNAPASEQQPEPTEKPEQAAETRAYTDALGREVDIPVTPEKVVVFTYGGYLLPLGMKPVGADKQVLELYAEEMAGVADVGEGKGNVEAVAALQPDLIIFPDYLGAETAAPYEKIAPTVAVAWGGDPDVIKTLATMGDLMNRKEQADAWIAKFEEKLTLIREQLSLKFEPDATALSFIIYNDEVLAGGETGTLGDLIYKDFGFELPEQYKAFANGGGVLSLEDLAAKPADYFFTQMTDEELAGMWELFESPIYQTIPAVKEKRIFNVSREMWNFGPYLVEKGVDELIKQVSELK